MAMREGYHHKGTGRRQRPIPEGFAEIAGRPHEELREIYGVGSATITRWRAELKDAGIVPEAEPEPSKDSPSCIYNLWVACDQAGEACRKCGWRNK